MNKLSSQDRSALIRLASSLPAGDETRKAILAGLSQTAALKPADLEALKKVEAEEGAHHDQHAVHPRAHGLVRAVAFRASLRMEPRCSEVLKRQVHTGIADLGVRGLPVLDSEFVVFGGKAERTVL